MHRIPSPMLWLLGEQPDDVVGERHGPASADHEVHRAAHGMSMWPPRIMPKDVAEWK